MKKKLINLSILLTGIFFVACSSNELVQDNKEVNINNALKLSAGITNDDSMESRVTTNAVNGLTTEFENNEILKVYHNFSGTPSTKTLDFENTSGIGSKASFTSTTTGYTFTASPLYVFSTLPTASNFTQTYNSDGTITLGLAGLNGQDGTVEGLHNWDAMYGYSADASANSVVQMNHLGTCLRFDMNYDTFKETDTTIKNITFSFDDATHSFLPSAASFTMKSDGTFAANPTLTGATSWSLDSPTNPNNIYLMTLPFQNLSGNLKISVTTNKQTVDGADDVHERYISLNNYSLSQNKMKAYSVTVPAEYLKTGHYHYGIGAGLTITSQNTNPPYEADFTGTGYIFFDALKYNALGAKKLRFSYKSNHTGNFYVYFMKDLYDTPNAAHISAPTSIEATAEWKDVTIDMTTPFTDASFSVVAGSWYRLDTGGVAGDTFSIKNVHFE